MSRTYNTDPFYIQIYRQIGVKPPRNWREVNHYMYRYRDGNKTAVEYDIENHIDNTFYRYGGMREICQEYAKIANRKYRARSRQLIREGNYEPIRQKRHAMWDAS